ncbi:unnamed protein product [Meloidogyne enterolobii]|uniref:Uncharacterized protein n=1 Tax=Meloidogyne enterolobii TaxID=390850 RepID=A0ACB1AX26_MELEN
MITLIILYDFLTTMSYGFSSLPSSADCVRNFENCFYPNFRTGLFYLIPRTRTCPIFGLVLRT